MAPLSTPLGRFALCVGLSLLTRGAFLGVDVIDMDEASYAVGSWELARGRLLYTEFADHKPPLVYAYFALGQGLFGRGLFAVRLLTVLVWVPLIAYALSAFHRNGRTGLSAALLFLLASPAFIAHDMQAVNCELLMLLPACAALVLVRDETAALRPRRPLAAGALLGLAVLFKYQAVLWAGAIVAAIATANGATRAARMRSIAALGLGLAIPPVAAYALFASRGAGADFIYWNWTHNVVYAAQGASAAEAIERALSYLLPFLLVTGPLWAASAVALRRRLPSYPRRLLTALLGFSALTVLPGLRLYPHYFVQLYPPLALAAALWVSAATEPRDRRVARALFAWLLVMLAGFTAAGLFLHQRRPPVYEERSPLFARVAARLREDRCGPGASLFVWGYAPLLYYEAGLPVASRFVYPDVTIVGYVPGDRGSYTDPARMSRIRADHWELLLADLERSRATFVVDTSPSALHGWNHFPIRDYPRLAEYLALNYEAVDRVSQVDIYRRRGCGPA